MRIRVTAKVQSKGDANKRVEAILQGMKGPKSVRVGFPAGAAPSDIIAIATYNHEGTSRGIPPRPFITTAMFKGRGELRSFLRAEAKSIIQGKGNLTQSMQRLGLKGVDLIQTQIASNMPPANAPGTVRQKGSSRTLIDTGRMLGAVTYKVEG